MLLFWFFFFKQKTAYEVRISDWSSDVCSSDLLIHPKRLPSDAQYAIDQYVLRGGRLVVFVDPDAELDTSPYAPDSITFPDRGSDLPRLFHAWGVSYDPRKIVLDRARALQIELAGSSLNHPAMLDLGRSEEHTSELPSLMRISYAVFCLKKKKQ